MKLLLMRKTKDCDAKTGLATKTLRALLRQTGGRVALLVLNPDDDPACRGAHLVRAFRDGEAGTARPEWSALGLALDLAKHQAQHMLDLDGAVSGHDRVQRALQRFLDEVALAEERLRASVEVVGSSNGGSAHPTERASVEAADTSDGELAHLTESAATPPTAQATALPADPGEDAGTAATAAPAALTAAPAALTTAVYAPVTNTVSTPEANAAPPTPTPATAPAEPTAPPTDPTPHRASEASGYGVYEGVCVSCGKPERNGEDKDDVKFWVVRDVETGEFDGEVLCCACCEEETTLEPAPVPAPPPPTADAETNPRHAPNPAGGVEQPNAPPQAPAFTAQPANSTDPTAAAPAPGAAAEPGLAPASEPAPATAPAEPSKEAWRA